MTSIAYKPTVRQWGNPPAINAANNDYFNTEGVRISLPCYVDLTIQQRKNLLNACRSKSQEQQVVSTPASASGITVETTSAAESDMESYLSMSFDVLRGVIFQRGGIPVDLVLRLQEVTGLEYVSAKDFTAAFKKRSECIKSYTKEYPYETDKPETA